MPVVNMFLAESRLNVDITNIIPAIMKRNYKH